MISKSVLEVVKLMDQIKIYNLNLSFEPFSALTKSSFKNPKIYVQVSESFQKSHHN